MHKLLLVPVTRVPCHLQLVLGEVVFDNTGLVFPIGSAYSVKLSNTIYCPILRELESHKKITFRRLNQYNQYKMDEIGDIKERNHLFAFHLFNLDSGTQNQISQNPWFKTYTLHWPISALFLNLFDNKQ